MNASHMRAQCHLAYADTGALLYRFWSENVMQDWEGFASLMMQMETDETLLKANAQSAAHFKSLIRFLSVVGMEEDFFPSLSEGALGLLIWDKYVRKLDKIEGALEALQDIEDIRRRSMHFEEGLSELEAERVLRLAQTLRDFCAQLTPFQVTGTFLRNAA
jgi:hypothetical protein